jgi:hypothetical protein
LKSKHFRVRDRNAPTFAKNLKGFQGERTLTNTDTVNRPGRIELENLTVCSKFQTMAAWKVMIAAFLGLVLQFTQIAAGVVPHQERPAPCDASTCHCCKGKEACPCAKRSSGEQAPLPTVPPVNAAKLDPYLLTNGVALPEQAKIPLPPAAEITLPIGTVRGFRGIPLTVSFCRFLI